MDYTAKRRLQRRKFVQAYHRPKLRKASIRDRKLRFRVPPSFSSLQSPFETTSDSSNLLDSVEESQTCDCTSVDDMSLLSPSRTYYSEKVRNAAGFGQAGKYRINVQIGTSQFHVSMQLPETRTFNYFMDELQPVFQLSDYQRIHTRIFLQTLLGETEILVNSRPNYQTERNVDYIGIPANPSYTSTFQRKGKLWFCLMLLFLLQMIGLGVFVAVDFLILRPQLVRNTQKIGANVSQLTKPSIGQSVPPAINASPVLPSTSPPASNTPPAVLATPGNSAAPTPITTAGNSATIPASTSTSSGSNSIPVPVTGLVAINTPASKINPSAF